jgi:hypothetical protein
MDSLRKRKMRFGDSEIDVICRAAPIRGADDGAMTDLTASEILNRDTEKYEVLSKRSLSYCIPNPNHPSRSDTEINQLQFPSDLLSPACRLGQLASASQDTVGWDVWEGATQLICQHLVLHAELVHGKRCVCLCFVSVCRSDWLNRQILSTYTCQKKNSRWTGDVRSTAETSAYLYFLLLLTLLLSPTHALIIQ